MKRFLLMLLPMCLLVTLSGCLEVDQHPHWVKGQYAGKKDDLQFATHFHKDRLSWWGTISNRNQHQNEYNRANP